MARLALSILAALVLAAVPAAAKEPLAPRTVFGLTWQGRQASFSQLDALTLKPVSKAVALGQDARYLGRSPGRGMRAAFATGEVHTRMVFVDLAKMKREGSVSLPCGVTGAVAWDVADRLLAACGGPATSVLVVNPATRKLRSRIALRGTLVDAKAAGGALVALLAPLDGIGQARLAVAGATGRVRTVALPGIEAGSQIVDTERLRMRSQSPALALSLGGERAVVVPAAGAVVEIDLARLGTVAHALSTRTLSRANKEFEGSVRHAVWTWSGTIAVSGWDGVPGQQDTSRAAGITLIDVTEWTSRPLGAGSEVATNGWSLLGWSSIWDPAAQRAVGNGLTGYSADGARRFHLFGEDAISVATIAGKYAYLVSAGARRFQIVDTESGALLGDVRTAKPTTLASAQREY